MPKTFADMTQEERQRCRGMWVKAQDEVGVLLASDVAVGVVFVPRVNDWFTPLLEEIEVLADLPRAWNPDGTPLQATRETAVGYDGLYLDARGAVFPADSGITYQRWVTDWEGLYDPA